MRQALGVDIGGTKTLIALVDDTGAVQREWRVPTDAARGGPALLAGLKQQLKELVASVDTRLAGVGVASAGQIDWSSGVVTYASPNLPGWTGTPLKAELEALLGLPVVVENDANAAAYGEAWVGAGRGARDLVMLTIGTGVGGGVVLDGKLWRGAGCRGGEIGHMALVADGVRCNCGQQGCLEMYASGTAIARLAREATPGFAGTAHDVFADPAHAAVVQAAARYLAQALVSLARLIAPERFLLGGGVMQAPGFLAEVRRAATLPEVCGQRGFDAGSILPAALGIQAGAVGAAGLLLHSR